MPLWKCLTVEQPLSSSQTYGYQKSIDKGIELIQDIFMFGE